MEFYMPTFLTASQKQSADGKCYIFILDLKASDSGLKVFDNAY